MPAQGESHKVYAEKFKATFEEVSATKTQPAVEPSVSEKAKSRSSAVSESPKKAAAAAAMPPAKSESVAPPVASVNYVYYDPEIHWCQVCDVFPRTAKEYLQHLHDAKHKEELTVSNFLAIPVLRIVRALRCVRFGGRMYMIFLMSITLSSFM